MLEIADISTFLALNHGDCEVVLNLKSDARTNRAMTPLEKGRQVLAALLTIAAAGVTGYVLPRTIADRHNTIPIVDQTVPGVLDPLITDTIGNPKLWRLAMELATVTDKTGRTYADNRIMRQGVENNPNYQAAMKRCREYLGSQDSAKFSSEMKKEFEKGFDAFGRFCANFNFDLSDAISKINITRKWSKKYRSHAFRRDVTYSRTPPASTIAHELVHTLYTDNPALVKVMSKNGYLRGGYYDQKRWFPTDITRQIIAGDFYSGKIYGDRQYRIKKPKKNNTAHKWYLVGAVDRYRNKTDPEWADEYNDEYLTSFVTSYLEPQRDKLPLLYAMDVRHKIDLVNEEARKMGIAYSGNDKTIQESLTHAAKRMLLYGIANKVPGARLMKMVRENMETLSQAYFNKSVSAMAEEILDNNAEKAYRTQQRK